MTTSIQAPTISENIWGDEPEPEPEAYYTVYVYKHTGLGQEDAVTNVFAASAEEAMARVAESKTWLRTNPMYAFKQENGEYRVAAKMLKQLEMTYLEVRDLSEQWCEEAGIDRFDRWHYPFEPMQEMTITQVLYRFIQEGRMCSLEGMKKHFQRYLEDRGIRRRGD